MKQQLRRRTIVFFCVTFFIVPSLFAQGNRPSWIDADPESKESYIGIAKTIKSTLTDTLSVTRYKEETYLDALWRIANQMPWGVDKEKSLFAVLYNKGLYKSSLNDVLLAEIRKSPFFKLKDEWEDEDEYWCYATIRKEDAENFIEHLVQNRRISAERIYSEAKNIQTNGNIYHAALKYVEALDSLHPAIFRFLPMRIDTGYVDFGEQLYDSYLNVYKDIRISTDVNIIPAIYNEGVPIELFVKVTQDSIPLQKVGIITTFKGDISVDPTTDNEGNCCFIINNIESNKNDQFINFAIDTDYLTDIPAVYGTNALKEASHFPSLRVPIKLFSPNTSIFINTQDSLLEENLKQIWRNAKDDVSFTKHIDSTDIVVDTELNIAKEKDISTNKYQLTRYNATMSIKARGVVDNSILLDYTLEDFKISLPSSRQETHVRESVIWQISKQLKREFTPIVNEYKFDKRSIVWNSLKPIK